MKLNNKIFILFLLTLFALLFFNVKSVFAVETHTFTGLDGKNYTVPLQITSDPNDIYCARAIFIMGNDLILWLAGPDGYFYSTSTNNVFKCSAGSYYYKIVDGEWSYIDYRDPNKGYANPYEFIYFTHDVYSNVSKTSVSYEGMGNFFLPVTEPEIPEETETTPALDLEILGQVIQTETPLAEILSILPLIIVVVVSLVGLRKALQMLLTLLRKS